MTVRFSSDQALCLREIARYGSAAGFKWTTVDSLRRRGLIDTATPTNPHPVRGLYAYWRLTEAGTAAYDVLVSAGECPRCGRLSVAYSVDRTTGNRILRRHLTPTGVWCNNGLRVDVGPGSEETS